MDFKKLTVKLGNLDKFLTALTKLLKKHWRLICLLGIGYFLYLAFTTDYPEEESCEHKEIVEPEKDSSVTVRDTICLED